MGTRNWVVRLRSHDPDDGEGRIIESADYRNPDAAMAAYRVLLGRPELVGTLGTAVFKPPANMVTDGNTSTWWSRFDCDVGDGRVAPDDPRLDPFATQEECHDVQSSLPPVRAAPQDWEHDGRTLAEALKSWHAAHGWTRDEAAAELRVPRSTYDGWCAGRSSPTERMARRLMTLIDRQGR